MDFLFISVRNKLILPFPDSYCINITDFQTGEIWQELAFYNILFIFHGGRLQPVAHVFQIVFYERRKEYVAGGALLVQK